MTTEDQTDLFGIPPEICSVEKDPTISGLEAMEDKAFERFCERHYALIDKLQEIGLPAPGQQFRIVTRRTFNAIQMLEYIADQERITALNIAIYSINYHAAKILLKLINSGKIAGATILMSNLRNSAHREKEEIIKKMFVQHPRIDIFYCSSHAKTFSCATEQGNYYTVEGSGNLAYNSRVEQYVIDNDQGMYDFSCQWMADIREYLKGTKELQEP